MAGKKCKCPPAGAPDWVMTFGDMMSLLLTFFILIVSMSEIKKEDEFKAVVEKIQQAFGIKGGGGKLPTQEDPRLSLLERIEFINLQNRKLPKKSNARDPGPQGRERKVTTIRPDIIFVKGGLITFEPRSSQLNDTARAQLRQVADQIRGYTNRIELRGHTDASEPNARTLSFARAQAVMDYLTGEDCKLDAARFSLIANADTEPLRHRAYEEVTSTINRRVEVVLSEVTTFDFATTREEPRF